MSIYLEKTRIIINKVIRLIYSIISMIINYDYSTENVYLLAGILRKLSKTEDITTEAAKITLNENFLQ